MNDKPDKNPAEKLAGGLLNFTARLQKHGRNKTGPIYGDIPNRMLAVMIDMILLLPITQFLPMAISPKFATPEDRIIFIYTYQYIILGIYIIPFVHKLGATPGKMVVGLKVVDNITGGKISLSQSIIRFLAYFTFPLGLLSASLRRDKRAWHDFIADTRVIYSPNRWYKRHYDEAKQRVRKFFNLPG